MQTKYYLKVLMLLFTTLNISQQSLGHANTDSENSLDLIFDNADEYIEESNGYKYLIFASADKNKEELRKYTKIWNKIKNQIEKINGSEPIKYKKDFTKIKFESYDDLPLVNALNILSMIIVTRFDFQKDSKYYPKIYLHKCGYYFVNEL